MIQTHLFPLTSNDARTSMENAYQASTKNQRLSATLWGLTATIQALFHTCIHLGKKETDLSLKNLTVVVLALGFIPLGVLFPKTVYGALRPVEYPEPIDLNPLLDTVTRLETATDAHLAQIEDLKASSHQEKLQKETNLARITDLEAENNRLQQQLENAVHRESPRLDQSWMAFAGNVDAGFTYTQDTELFNPVFEAETREQIIDALQKIQKSRRPSWIDMPKAKPKEENFNSYKSKSGTVDKDKLYGQVDRDMKDLIIQLNGEQLSSAEELYTKLEEKKFQKDHILGCMCSMQQGVYADLTIELFDLFKNDKGFQLKQRTPADGGDAPVVQHVDIAAESDGIHVTAKMDYLLFHIDALENPYARIHGEIRLSFIEEKTVAGWTWSIDEIFPGVNKPQV